MNPFESRLHAVLGKFLEGNVLLAAVSGGADSTAMLAGIAALRGEAPFTLACVHVEHGLRPPEESRGDARAVEAICEKLAVPCKVISVPPGRIAAFASKSGIGVEAAARLFRHRAFARERRRIKADRILTAHTRDDLLENILMRVLRGAGPAGLAAMPKSRGRLFRPLLDFTRQDLLAYLEEKDLQYRTDSTNSDTRFLRNRVRLLLVPLLDTHFPSWRSTLPALAETQALTANFLAAEAGKRLPWDNLHSGGGEVSLRLPEGDFLAAPPVLREEAVFSGVNILAADAKNSSGWKKSLKVPRRSALRLAVKGSAEDLGPVRLERKNGFICLKPKNPPLEKGFSLLIKEPGFYNLKRKASGLGQDLRIRVGVPSDWENPETEAFPQTYDNAFHGAFYAAFHAQLPLVFRNHRKSDCIFKDKRELRGGISNLITACDIEGPAAFIIFDGDLTVISRENSASFLVQLS